MIQFAKVFPDKEIVVSLIRQLSWTHFIAFIPLKDDLQRDFYAEMCRKERWSTRTLKSKIQGMLYERTAISKKPEKLIKKDLAALREEDRLTPDLVFRDPLKKETIEELQDTFISLELGRSIQPVIRTEKELAETDIGLLQNLFLEGKILFYARAT